uniref:RNA-directed DNA polymerase n=1 Tax=Caenorhabditis tropicalis TaxID=1561998 RepID=A0A1I7UR57_9PELO
MIAGYWQLPLEEKSKPTTAFAIGSELFEWEVLPFGLVTSPAIFQATMEAIVGDLLGKSVFLYVDDILVASDSIEEHADDLRRVFARIELSGAKFRASKCCIAKTEVAYLGHKISPEGIKTEEKKVEKMKHFERPTNVKELQSFLGLVGYYRKFIFNFAQTAASLTPLTSKKTAWIWGQEQEQAFQQLIQSVCTTPVLAQPDAEAAANGRRPFLIYTDASKKGVGAVLAQEGEDGEQHPIAFISKALTPAESRYHVTDLEALGMVYALRRFKAIIYGTQVVVYTDHQPLVSLLKGSPLSDRLMRWSLEVIEYNIKIVFVKGKANAVADALSRGGCPIMQKENENETEEMISVISEVKKEEELEHDLWFAWLREEEGWKELIERLKRGETEGRVKIPGLRKEVELKHYKLIGSSLRNTEHEGCSRWVVPERAIKSLIREAHEGLLAGHFGTEKMMKNISKKFFFVKMRAHIDNWVKGCQKCLCVNDVPKLISPLTPYKTNYPLQIVACDLIDVGLSTQGNRYILTIIDLFTKYAIGVPIPDKKADTVIKAFVDRWAIGEGRIPEVLLTDQGKEFVNEQFKTFSKKLGIKHITTKGYNSRANGAVERFNKTLMHIHTTTGESPWFLMYGKDPKGGLERMGEDTERVKYVDIDEYKHLLVQELDKAFAFVRVHAQEEQDKYKVRFDQKHLVNPARHPTVGSRVLIEIPSEKLGSRCPKLINSWKGPYRVVSCSENSVVVIPIGGSVKQKQKHKIPLENVRVVPSQMDDTIIETKKGRARVNEIAKHPQIKYEYHEGETIEDGVETMINVNSCRDLYKCRCEKMCKFSFRDVQSNSPTHFARMMNLVKVLQEKHGLSEMTDLEKYNAIPRGVIAHIPMLAHKVINNVVADVPNGETWLILSKCASLPLWIRDIVGWEAAFSFHRAVALQEVLGVHLLKPGKTWLYLMPGVKREKVCLEADHEYLLDEDPNLTTEKIRKDLKVNGKGMIILVTPASEQYQDLELWQTAVTAIPPSFEVVVIPTFVQNEDFESLERCGKNMEQLIRDGNAPLKVYSMNKKPSGYRNRSIATISDGMRNEYEYFKFIQEVVEAESPTMAIRVAKAPTGNSSKTQLMQLHDDNDCGIDAIATTSSDIATTSSGGGPMRQRMGHIKKPWKRNEYQGGRGARGGGSFRRH